MFRRAETSKHVEALKHPLDAQTRYRPNTLDA
jgi:hypothetical protein